MTQFEEGDSILFRAKWYNKFGFHKAEIIEIAENGSFTIRFTKTALADRTLSSDDWAVKFSKGWIKKVKDFQHQPLRLSNANLETVNSRHQSTLNFFLNQPTFETNDHNNSEASDSESPELTESSESPSASVNDASVENTSMEDNPVTETEPSDDDSLTVPVDISNFHDAIDSLDHDSTTTKSKSKPNLESEVSDDGSIYLDARDELDEEDDEAEDNEAEVKDHRRGDFEEKLFPIDLKTANLVPLLIMNGNLIQVMLSPPVVAAMSCTLFQKAKISFLLRNYFDVFSSKTGKLACSILHFGKGGVSKPELSFSCWTQIQPMLKSFFVEYRKVFGTMQIWDSIYIPSLVTGNKIATIKVHQDSERKKRKTMKHVGRMCLTTLDDNATKRTIFTYKPNGNGNRVNAGSSIKNPHCSILFMDEYASGSYSNIYHDTKIEGGASGTLVADLFTDKNVSMKDVVQHMIDHKILIGMDIEFEIE